MFVILCTVEYMNYRNLPDVFWRWGQGFGKFMFAFIVIALLFAVILLIVRKLWLSATLYGAFMLILSLINCIKLAVNGDYFFPWDVSMAGNLGTLVSFASFDIPPLFYLGLGLCVLFCFLFWFSDVKLPLKWYFGIPSAVAVCIAVLVFYNYPKQVEKTLVAFGMSFNDSILQSSNYTANGFVNAFTINCFALNVGEPEGYGEESINACLSDYTATEATESPDVIVILSEAFSDIRELDGTEFSQNPLSNYDEICARKNCASGRLYTTAIGGGTVRTEFEMLTGLTVDYLTNGTSPYLYITGQTDSYVSNYRAQGYKTTAVHTYDGKFYMRNTAYPHLGFDEFISQTEVAQNYDTTFRRSYITDDTFMNVVIDTLEKNTDTPNFIFGITMENHQAYTKSAPDDIVIDVKNDKLTPDVLDSVTTYTQGVYYADRSLKKIVDYIDSREKPTVLLFFGDHLPTLGSNQAAYKQAGNVSSEGGYNAKDRAFLYSTPYLVYSNCGYDFGALETESGGASTYYMLSLIAKATGTKMTPYMNYLADNYESLPYYNVRLNIKLDEKGKDFINSMKLITFDRLKGNKYSVR